MPIKLYRLMKNFILTFLLLLAAGFTYGQSIQKGNLLGVHNLTVKLEADVTMNQFKDFFSNKVIPEYEKYFTGVKAHLLEGVRGDNKNSLGLLFFFESENVRNKYFNEDGSQSDLGIATFEKLQSVQAELAKLGTWTSKYTDWIVQ